MRFPQEQLLVLGGGSNVLLPESLDKVVLRFEFEEIKYQPLASGDVLVKVDAGRNWDELVADTVSKGLRGLENLSYIPGSVGAAPVQNIGAYGVELSDVLESVRVYDTVEGTIRDLDNKQCQFAYRDSIFKRNSGRYCILELTLRLSSTADFCLEYGELQALRKTQAYLDVAKVREAVIGIRKAKLPEPEDLPNAGSFFKNPVVSREALKDLKAHFPDMVSYGLGDGRAKLAAAWLIDQAGWKGKCFEHVGVHSKQALVLVNLGGATQSKVLALAKKIQDSVYSIFKVRLEIEPQLILPSEIEVG